MEARMAGFSKKRAVRLGKVGRPMKDPVRERLRIYRAAGPLILERGVRRATIDRIARVACLSPGGIYHWFGSKRRLVLYGLEPEALSAACREEAEEIYRLLAAADPPRVSEIIRLYADKNARMVDFVRPALHAAIELGRPELRRRLSAGIQQDADFLVSALGPLHTDPAKAEESASAIRRTVFGLAVDESVSAEEVRRQLLWLFRRLMPRVTPGI